MKNYQIKFTQNANTSVFEIIGTIDETFSESAFKISDNSQIHFNLEGLTYINSTGVREWMKLMKKADSCQMTFEKCPKVFIDQINLVKGFVNVNSKILSFYVPYFSSQKNIEKNVLFLTSTLDSEEKINQADTITIEGLEFEIDVLPDRYFKFIKSFGST